MKITNSEYLISAVKKQYYPNITMPQYLLLGRSNVGKSSFINCITNRKNLAFTSSKPGKTQTLNFYLCNKSFMFVDAPGYGYSKNSKEQRVQYGMLLEEYLGCNVNLKRIFLILDIRIDPTEDDMLVYEFLKQYSFKVSIILTKADKLSNNETRNRLNLFNNFFDNELITFSSVKGIGKEKIELILDESI